MNNKGLTLVELLITIVVMGIIATFAVPAIGDVIDNAKKDTFVVSATNIIDAARDSYTMGSTIWDDNTVTARELVDNGYLERLPKDPWKGEFHLDDSFVIVEEAVVSRRDLGTMFYLSNDTVTTTIFKCKIVSDNAVIGYEGALEVFSRSDVVLLNEDNVVVVENETQTYEGSVSDSVETSSGDDTINVDDHVEDSANISTKEGNDTINVGRDIKDDSVVNTGDGDDVINMNGEVQDDASIDTGAGNDTINIDDDIQNDAVVNTGTGDDTVNIGDDLQHNAVLDTGEGNDAITVGDDVDGATINTGAGDDNFDIETLKNDSNIDMGDDNDTVEINDVSSSYDGGLEMGSGDDELTIIDKSGSSKDLKWTDGTFDGGSGYDTLNLPYITIKQWNDYVSDLFTGFEKVVLEDGIIYP